MYKELALTSLLATAPAIMGPVAADAGQLSKTWTERSIPTTELHSTGGESGVARAAQPGNVLALTS